MESESTKTRIVVAVLTYKRPTDLAEVAPLLLTEIDSVRPIADAELLVVDNDPAGGAAEQVRGMEGSGDFRYAHEPTPGIAAARNRALAEAAGADYLVFIDDDERPTEGWLGALLATATTSGATAVAGPVISRFAVEPDEWVKAGRFFDRRRLPTGTPVAIIATNNLIIDLHQLERLGVTFDERFGLAGGSDTLFSLQVGKRGGTMVWCDEAIVYDEVPAERVTREWVLKRARRSGNSWALTSLAATPSRGARMALRVRLTAKGLVRVGGGSVRYLGGVLSGRMSAEARGRRTYARGIGLLAGATGAVFSEYRRT